MAGPRERVATRIDRIFGADAPLARALLVADQKAIPLEMRDRYAAAGIVHMLSISGLHVAIIAAAIELLLLALHLSRRTAALVSVVVVVAYVALLAFPPPALRSAVMLALVAAGRGLQRPSSPWAALAVGAWIPLILPRTALDLGYQLSVAGMAALTAAGVVLRGLSRDWTPLRARLARDAVASVLASVVSAPLVAWHFGRLSLIGPLANLAAAPVIALVQPTLFFALLLSPSPAAARFVADAAHPLLMSFDTVARVFAALPFASVDLAPGLFAALGGSVCAGCLVIACCSRHPGRALISGGLAAMVVVWAPALPRRTDGNVQLHVIDVGQGDAVALRTGRGNWILFDAGRAWRTGDAGRSTIIPYIRRRGGRVLALVISHPHSDHVGGAASVVRWLRPREIWDPAYVVPARSYHATLVAAQRARVTWRRVHPGDSLDADGVVVKFLAPDSAWATRLADPNEASAVALVRYGDVRFLLTGDAERAEEDWMLKHGAWDLDVDVLKVAHHGSITSSAEAFLAAVSPRIAIISVGAENAYGHPSADVVRRLARHRSTVLRTDRDGTVVVETDGRSLRIRARGDEWDLPGERGARYSR